MKRGVSTLPILSLQICVESKLRLQGGNIMNHEFYFHQSKECCRFGKCSTKICESVEKISIMLTTSTFNLSVLVAFIDWFQVLAHGKIVCGCVHSKKTRVVDAHFCS